MVSVFIVGRFDQLSAGLPLAAPKLTNSKIAMHGANEWLHLDITKTRRFILCWRLLIARPTAASGTRDTRELCRTKLEMWAQRGAGLRLLRAIGRIYLCARPTWFISTASLETLYLCGGILPNQHLSAYVLASMTTWLPCCSCSSHAGRLIPRSACLTKRCKA